MSGSGDFELHNRLGRLRNRHIRLTRGSICLLTVALICWLAGLSWQWQLPLSLVAGLTGLAWPVSGSRAWALSLIGQQGGLAYETALAMESGPRDDYGLRSQVRSRARSSVAGIERPHMSDWWIAALVVALAVLLLPLLQVRAPWQSPPIEPPQAEAAATTDDDQDEPEAEAVAEPEQPAEVEQLLPPQAAQAPEAGAEPGSAASGAGDGVTGDTEVLDRFLDNLRERPRESSAAAEIAGSPVPAPLDEPPPPNEEESEGTSPTDDVDEEDGADRSDGETGAGQGDDGEAGGQQQDEGEAGTPENSENEGAAQPDGAPAPADAGNQDPGGQDGPAPDAGLSEGDGAGGGAGAEVIDMEAQRPGEAGGEEELLEGLLSGSEVNLGGDIRLPGFSDVELPPGVSPGQLGQAVERSLTEGTVPLEYQEVIRNYFR